MVSISSQHFFFNLLLMTKMVKKNNHTVLKIAGWVVGGIAGALILGNVSYILLENYKDAQLIETMIKNELSIRTELSKLRQEYGRVGELRKPQILHINFRSISKPSFWAHGTYTYDFERHESKALDYMVGGEQLTYSSLKKGNLLDVRMPPNNVLAREEQFMHLKKSNSNLGSFKRLNDVYLPTDTFNRVPREYRSAYKKYPKFRQYTDERSQSEILSKSITASSTTDEEPHLSTETTPLMRHGGGGGGGGVELTATGGRGQGGGGLNVLEDEPKREKVKTRGVPGNVEPNQEPDLQRGDALEPPGHQRETVVLKQDALETLQNFKRRGFTNIRFREVQDFMNEMGYEPEVVDGRKKSGGSHIIFSNGKYRVPVPRHPILDGGTLRSILFDTESGMGIDNQTIKIY